MCTLTSLALSASLCIVSPKVLARSSPSPVVGPDGRGGGWGGGEGNAVLGGSEAAAPR